MSKVWLDINNRDIKFRVFDRPGQKMYYLTDNMELMFTNKDGEYRFDVIQRQCTPDRDNCIRFSITDSLNGHLMQNTGFVDNNGIEIYEGDILGGKLVDRNVHYEVVFQEGSWKCRNKTGPDTFFYVHLSLIKYGLYILGNIYQNPDIIK